MSHSDKHHEQHSMPLEHHHHGETGRGDFEAQRIQEMKHKDPKLAGNQWIEKQNISGEKPLVKHIGTQDERSPHSNEAEEHDRLKLKGHEVFHAEDKDTFKAKNIDLKKLEGSLISQPH